MQQLDRDCGGDEKEVVGQQVEPCPLRGCLFQAPSNVAVEKVGRAGNQQSETDNTPVAEHGCGPEKRYEQQAKPGEGIRKPPP